MAAKKKSAEVTSNTGTVEELKLVRLNTKRLVVTIEGDSDLVLNKMNNVTARKLANKQTNKPKEIEIPNVWEEIITSMHWRDGDPEEFSQKTLKEALLNNAPCLTAFGFFKSFGDAIVRNEMDKYKTKYEANVRVIGPNGSPLIPIKFATHNLDEHLMSPKTGSPVLTRLNRFSGWSAEFSVRILDSVYTPEQILNVINLAGFGLGIGSGRSSGNGRYHVTHACLYE